MFSLIITKEVNRKIINFLDSYLNSFIHLFVDSWIYNADIIEENYIRLTKDFERNIYLSLRKRLDSDVVLWKKIEEDNSLSITIFVWNWKLYIKYTENIVDKIRIIYNIKIDKK